MIDLANNYVNEVNNLLLESVKDLKFKYYHPEGYANTTYKPREDTWQGIDFVIINDDTKLVEGFVQVTFKRPYQKTSITIMHKGKSSNFLGDLRQIIIKLFIDLKVPKITWCVLIGNRAEVLYDRFISKNAGRVVGVFYKDTVAFDGEICDVKHYEILREDFIKSQELDK